MHHICTYAIFQDLDIASDADDTTPYICEENLILTIESIEKGSDLTFLWFSNNHMKANEDKCHVLFSTNENVFIDIGTVQIQNSSSEKLLGTKIDSKLNFKGLIGSICKNASSKLNALTRVLNYMNPDMNGFSSSHFAYCPLTWMCYIRIEP